MCITPHSHLHLPQETPHQGETADSMIPRFWWFKKVLRPTISCAFLGNFASRNELPVHLDLADFEWFCYPESAVSPLHRISKLRDMWHWWRQKNKSRIYFKIFTQKTPNLVLNFSGRLYHSFLIYLVLYLMYLCNEEYLR
jgi:hypothetical protein